jgi:hypothetical protein
VIVSLHVATGAAAGAATGSRLAAVLLGPILHLAGDRLPHQDTGSRRFEIGSGLAALVLLAARRGPVDPATLGAAASSAPDLEHVLPFLRPGGSKLFHGRRGWHRSGRFPADLQLLLAGAILGALVARQSELPFRIPARGLQPHEDGVPQRPKRALCIVGGGGVLARNQAHTRRR